MNENNQGIQLFGNLLDKIADTKSELIKPDDFADRSHDAYEALLDGLEAYITVDGVYHLNRHQEMEARLEVLLTRANGIVAIHKEVTGDINISPYRSGLAMYVSTQLKEALALIHPDSMKKYNLLAKLNVQKARGW